MAREALRTLSDELRARLAPPADDATLSPVQEQVARRQTPLLPLDDLLAVTREVIRPEVSRSGLDRCLRRHGVSNLSALIPQPDGAAKPVKTFKDDAPGFVHVHVKYLPQMPCHLSVVKPPSLEDLGAFLSD